MLLGVISGTVLGLFFHRSDWAGGYVSFRRRLVRLAHISFFGLGILNVLFATTAPAAGLSPLQERIASLGLLVALVTMPACCFLTAWREPFRFLFPVPVVGLFAAIVAFLLGALHP